VGKRLLVLVLVVGSAVLGLPAASQATVTNLPNPRFPTFDGRVLAIAERGDTVYVGGDFDTVTGPDGTTRKRHSAAAFDVDTGRVLRWNPNVKGEVRDIAVGREGVYLVGRFLQIKGEKRHHVARVASGGKGRLHENVRRSTNAPVNAVVLSKKRVYIGGGFRKLGLLNRRGLASFDREAPFLPRDWKPKVKNGEVLDLVGATAGIYVAGTFDELNGDERFGHLALVKAANGKTVRRFNPQTKRVVHDIDVRSGRVYAAMGGPRGGAAYALDGRSGTPAWSRRMDGEVLAIRVLHGEVYLGGTFKNVCTDHKQLGTGACRNSKTVRYRGASVLATGGLGGWNPHSYGSKGISVIHASKQGLAVGGGFTTMGAGTSPTRAFALFTAQ
jgi:outer membrane protein assembly factor BamB